MPVTFFIFGWSLDCFVMMVLNAKPKQNDVASAKIINVAFFILSERSLSFVICYAYHLRLAIRAFRYEVIVRIQPSK